jgi:1,4-dihydroxy-2-naphthoate octaprenyltransferase
MLSFNVYTVGVALYALMYRLGEVPPRISFYYLIYLIILVPAVLKFYRVKQAYFVSILATSLLYTYNFYLIWKNDGKNAFMPYQTFLFVNEKTYDWSK